MKKILSIPLGIAFAATLVGTAFAGYTHNNGTFCTQDVYICPNGTAVARTGSSCQFICPDIASNTSSNNSYTYTEGCYTMYYNGYTKSISILSNNCSTNYNSNYYSNYTYPTYTNPTYYTVPSTYYTNTYTAPSTYYYQNTVTYPTTYTTYNPGYNSSYYYYNTGYTNTGYNNYHHNNNYSQPSSCYWIGGFQVCF